MNLEQVKKKLQSLESNKSKTKALWKPEYGEQVVRFIPNKFKPDFPFLEMFFYYDLEKYPVVSPISFGEPDPIVELANELKSTGNKEDWKMGIKLEPKLRTYAPILVRGEEKEGVKFYGFGRTVFQALLKLIEDPDYGDITDPKTGTDITIEYSKGSDGGYPETLIRPKRNVSPMTESKEVLELVKNMPDPTDIWQAPSYDEMQSKLEAFTNKSGEGESESNESPQEEKKADAATTEKETGIKPSNDVDSLMSDIFG